MLEINSFHEQFTEIFASSTVTAWLQFSGVIGVFYFLINKSAQGFQLIASAFRIRFIIESRLEVIKSNAEDIKYYYSNPSVFLGLLGDAIFSGAIYLVLAGIVFFTKENIELEGILGVFLSIIMTVRYCVLLMPFL